jgi:4-hydroxy-tetrahydrodipicolinate reductase
MSAIRVAIIGANGRMGLHLCEVTEATPAMILAARVVGEGEDGGVPLAKLDPQSVDVLVDFSHRSAVAEIAQWVERNGKPWVLGTTGLAAYDEQALEQAAKRAPVFLTSNFSIGVALLADLCARAARVLGVAADIEIVETHHHGKRDAPSGTALSLGHAVAAARGQDLSTVRRDGRVGQVGERPEGEIGFHAVRLADIVGEHEVHFGWGSERLVLKHDARDRRVFAQGAIRAAGWLVGQKPGRYGMADLLRD